MTEYFEMGHAEPVPAADLEKPMQNVFYLPMHAVRKESSTTTKLRAVFDASAKSSTGVSLNKTLLVGPTVPGADPDGGSWGCNTPKWSELQYKMQYY